MKNEFRHGSQRTLSQSKDAQAYDNMIEVAGMLTSTSYNNWAYEVEDCYLDFGQKWMWTTIICYGNDGDKHQVLNPAEWVQICNAKSEEELKQIVDEIKSDKYFQDRDRSNNLDEVFNGGQTPGEFVLKMAQGFARENPETIKKLENKEKTIEQTAEELSNQFPLITKEMWEEVLKAACFCDTTPIEESFEDEHGVESITEEQPQVEIPAQDPNNQDNGLVALVNSLIQDEFDAIQQYKDAITNFAANNKTELTTVLQDILDEENIHVGQLQSLLNSLDVSSLNIETGKQEGQEQIDLATNTTNEVVTEDLDKKEETEKCSICGKEFTGYGNNAHPINDGVCCDDCNTSEVIPARLKQIVKGDK